MLLVLSEFKEKYTELFDCPQCITLWQMRAEMEQGFLLLTYDDFPVWTFKGEKILILTEV